MIKIIDLFSGLGGFTAAFEEDNRYNVTTVDIEPDFEPNIVADVLDLHWTDLPDADIITASPPCNAFTVLRIGDNWEQDDAGRAHPIDDFARTSLQLVYHTVGLIKAIDPDWWVMENPRGMMRRMFRPPDYEVWYCKYGAPYPKPTDLWGRLPPSFEPQSCSYGNPFCDHTRASRGEKKGIQSLSNSAERAMVPCELSDAIKTSIEHPEPMQSTLI
jgi:hypothetical protein